ncbi:hypothetical protein K435DRAFT_701877, partial [Dendrothele bispora CBS 962.96]
GTPKVGGWTTREMKCILRGLTGLNFFSVDIVEVPLVYDTTGKVTTLLAIFHSSLSSLLTLLL